MRIWTLAALLVSVGCHPERSPVPPRHDVAVPPEDAGRIPDAAMVFVDGGQPTTGEDGELREETPDRDPRSATVKLKLMISPVAQGVVSWGHKKLAELKPGHMVVQLDRPRGSGPLDLVIRANGFLPHHVRMFSDRDDKLSVRLFRPEEAAGLLGYRRAAAPSP